MNQTRQLIAHGATGALADFNRAGVLSVADVHLATRLGVLGNDPDPDVALAIGLTSRALRAGSVCIDLSRIHERWDLADDEEQLLDLSDLPWPQPDRWRDAVAASPLVATEDDPSKPLRLDGQLLHLQRFWLDEEAIRLELARRAETSLTLPPDLDLPARIAELFDGRGLAPGEPDRQAEAAERAVRSHLTVLAGGPGTGKTTTVARILALLTQLPSPGPRWRIALAAPTGKAASRLQESVEEARDRLPASVQTGLPELLPAKTIHRLLGSRFDSFVHGPDNPIPHDIVVVDETSMVSIPLLAQLLTSVRPSARLILIGDPDQLTPVGVGAVLAHTVAASARPESAVSGRVVTLERTWRFDGAIAALARAVQSGDADTAVAVLNGAEAPQAAPAGAESADPATAVGGTGVPTALASELGASPGQGVHWLLGDPHDPDAAELAPLRAAVRGQAAELVAAARLGDAERALTALGSHRLLCAHRRGPYGVAQWSRHIEAWIAPLLDRGGRQWYAGRPVMMSENRADLDLYNGDTGVTLEQDGQLQVAFWVKGRVRLYSPHRLDGAETVWTSTVHKAQGSQFDRISVVLPPASPLLTRELFYTAITRAKEGVILAATADAVRTAVTRPTDRTSGLADRL
ncbi:exodeoxyribonuclease V subunit alpha [Parenemella sanctibonifatiensis]|uniref:RecBCD enzyme subunit RecD n=1 Tax=Parenemella sanctibonifatiensis TaxID=2016505 RepID=A0A255EIV1_9ACTN|nr:exodeoxyribonuclease V subunit alpha [Parenemella sanctibonifatiensis]OYN90911.1 exodeoxyribonuclease V subunit alpha [Parenemella sanctibonifatiensis]